MKNKAIAILFLIAFPITFFALEPLLGININNFYSAIGSYFLCATVLLCWVGFVEGWAFAANNGWGCFFGLFSVYFGILLSVPIALYQLFFYRLFSSFKKFLIVIILLVITIVTLFVHFPEFSGFWGHLGFFYVATTAALFWIGIPAGWNLIDNSGCIAIIFKIIFSYIAMFLSLPIAIVQLFKEE